MTFQWPAAHRGHDWVDKEVMFPPPVAEDFRKADNCQDTKQVHVVRIPSKHHVHVCNFKYPGLRDATSQHHDLLFREANLV